VDMRDVRMVQCGEDFSFALEPGKTLWITRHRSRQHFDRHLTLQGGVRGAIDLAHTAGTERAGDFVRAEALAGRKRHASGRDSIVAAIAEHTVNFPLVLDGVLDPKRPEIILYEPMPNGRLRITGADYLVLAEAWHANNVAPPEPGGLLLHFFESPNRFGLPPFYTLHVWASKENGNGAFVNWHPKVSCDGLSGPTP
jgi:hypothetical protein